MRGSLRPFGLALFRGLPLALVACGGAASNGAGPGAPGSSTASSTLTVSGCVIAEGSSACSGSISWSITGAQSPRVTLDGVMLSTEATGSASPMLGASTHTAAMFDGAELLGERTLSGVCASASTWDGAHCLAYAERITARAPTPFVEGGRPVTLEVVLFRPFGPSPFPAVMFHHGSTGDGSDPSLFTLTYTSENIARFFTERGWLVAFAQRRGRGASDGLYDEGFTPDRSGYSCVQSEAIAGFEHAMLDVDAAVAYVAERPDVNPARLLSAGISRGGVLALTHAAERPGVFLGAVNFVGGWLGEGCAEGPAVNRHLFERAGRFPEPSVWMYGENDSFYRTAHSRANFEAFVAAGGQGAFHVYTRASTLNGHYITNDPHLWTADLDAYLQQLDR